MKRNAKWVLVVGLLFGVMSRLYSHTPFGYIGMFDLVSYGLAPVLFVRMAGKLTSREHGYLAMILLWVFGSAVANPANGHSGAVTLKAVGITASMWCMSVVCFALLTASPLVVLYFLIGNYLGAVIGLYIFQNGAYLEYALNMGYSEGYIGKFLVEKQVLPAWLSMICMAGGMTVLLVWRRCPYWVLSVLFFAAAFISLYRGGSRS